MNCKGLTILTMLLVVAALTVTSQVHAAVIDATTQGDWIGTYGSDGYILVNYDGPKNEYSPLKLYDRVSLPSYVTDYTYTNAGTYSVGASADVRCLQDPASPTQRKLSVAERWGGSPTVISFTLAADAPDFQLASYLGWCWTDASSQTNSVNWQGESAFDSGTITYPNWPSQYVVFDVRPNGKTQLELSLTWAGTGTNRKAVTGMFFHPIPEPSTLALLLFGGFGLLVVRRWRK